MAMTEQEILAGLGEIVDEVAGVPADQVTPDKTFVDDLDIDSLSMVEIAVAAQDKFGVEIPDDQLKDLKTVQDVIDYVRRAAVIGLTGELRQRSGAARAAARPGRVPSDLTRESTMHCGHMTGRTSSSPGSARPRRSAPMSPRPGRRCWPGAAACVKLTDDWAAELPARIAGLGRGRPGHADRPRAGPPPGPVRAVRARSPPARPGRTPARREVDPDRLGVVVSSGIGGVASTLPAYDTLREKGWQRAVAAHRPDAHAERLGGLDRH